MKKIKWNLFIVALLGIVLASANKAPHFTSYHKYAWLRSAPGGTKYYISKDLTDWGWVYGIDYYCDASNIICTFMANPLLMHTDAGGKWFYVTDVVQASIDYAGNFLPVTW